MTAQELLVSLVGDKIVGVGFVENEGFPPGGFDSGFVLELASGRALAVLELGQAGKIGVADSGGVA